MFEEMYAKNLEHQTRDLALMEVGVVAEAGNLIIDNVKPASDNKLTLQDVYHIADVLNSLLTDIERKKEEVEYTTKKLEEERSAKQATGATA